MGLRFPLQTLIHQLFFSARIHLVDTHANAISLLMRVAVLNFVHRLNLSLEEILFLHNMKRVEEGKFFFISNKSSLQLVLSLPNTYKGYPPGNVLVKGSWGYRDDPDLSFYPINLSQEQLGVSSLPLLLFLFLFQILTLSRLFSCLFECFLLSADKGDRRQGVEWLSVTKFEQVWLTLLLLQSSRHYKTMLIKENLQGVCRHPHRFTRAPLPCL